MARVRVKCFPWFLTVTIVPQGIRGLMLGLLGAVLVCALGFTLRSVCEIVELPL